MCFILYFIYVYISLWYSFTCLISIKLCDSSLYGFLQSYFHSNPYLSFSVFFFSPPKVVVCIWALKILKHLTGFTHFMSISFIVYQLFRNSCEQFNFWVFLFFFNLPCSLLPIHSALLRQDVDLSLPFFLLVSSHLPLSGIIALSHWTHEWYYVKFGVDVSIVPFSG